jgi:hypothetical protein
MLKYLIPFLLVSSLAFADEAKIKTPKLDKVSCSTNFEQMKSDLHNAGYTALFVAKDVKNKSILHEVMYDAATDHLASITMYTEADGKTVDKICLDNVLVEPYGFGPTFRDFVVHQKIDDFNKAADAVVEEKKKHALEEHDPFQGDPTKS